MNSPESVAAGAGKLNVLVVATQKDAIAKAHSVVAESGLTASFFEIEIFLKK